MFDLPLIDLATTERTGPGQWVSEGLATFGPVGTILTCLHTRSGAIPATVGFYITAAYWFTASTSLANPAVTLALTDTATGISSVIPFIAMQLLSALLATFVFTWLTRPTDMQR